MRTFSWIVLALVAACGGAAIASSGATSAPVTIAAPASTEHMLAAIEIYGTRQITLEQVLSVHGKELRELGEALMRQDASVQTRTETILAKLNEMGDFADVTPSFGGTYGPGVRKYYLALDFVDRVDAARRMPFLPAPTGTYQDPEGLIADWQGYESKVTELMGSGQMSPNRVNCPAFHCLGDHTNPAVKQLAARFAALVPAHVEELSAILRDDHDGRHRAAAAFLLAYSKDGPALVKLMVGAFRDRSALVRNNAMRVIAEVAFYHPELDVPIEPVLEALDYPATTDRNKAAAILDGLLKQPGAAARNLPVARRVGATLLAMLRLEQPNNHNFAYSILKTISGKSFGERDYAAWEAWLKSCAGC